MGSHAPSTRHMRPDLYAVHCVPMQACEQALLRQGTHTYLCDAHTRPQHQSRELMSQRRTQLQHAGVCDAVQAVQLQRT